MISLQTLPNDYRAVIIGASGGIGGALCDILRSDPHCGEVIGFSRSGAPKLDLIDEASIESAARHAGENGPVHLLICASGFLHGGAIQPEKSIKALSPEGYTQNFAVNAAGPLLVLKHFAPLFPRKERAVFAALSARVGSISDNRLGGWYAYRAAKAALNMGLKTASIEFARTHKALTILALHPGTVATELSAPFAGSREVFTSAKCAEKLLAVIDGAHDTGSFLAYDGQKIAW